jgi:NhaP-type Na+/H+ or K+/H+ antiporter
MVEALLVELTVLGLIILGVSMLPRLLSGRILSAPICYLGFGVLLFSLPIPIPTPNPLTYPTIVEQLTEIALLVSLMGAGLRIDRPFDLRGWESTWRLLGVAMPIAIVLAAFLGWWVVGLAPAAALLFGAALAPTDPVLASDVQVGPPGISEDDRADENEVRFALTSEAGLNDGLAVPFMNLAIAIAVAGLWPANWAFEWLFVDVLYRITAGTAMGYLLGRGLAWLLFSVTDRWGTPNVAGINVLAGTFIVYGLTEIVGGYGFLSVFVAGLVIRDYERDHVYNAALHDFAELIENLVMAVLIVLFGGALATGLLSPLTTPAMIVGAALLLFVRPLAGLVSLRGFEMALSDRAVVAGFGVRGIGAFYYLSHGLNEAAFPTAELLWALVGFVVLCSILLHGMSATPVMARLDGGD